MRPMSCPTTLAFWNPERARQRMNAHRSSLHVQTVRGDLRVPNLWSAHYTRMGAVAPQRLGQ